MMRWLYMLTGLSAALLWPGPLWAAGGGGGGQATADVLVILAVVGVAYAVAHLLLERLAERFGIATGVEYIVLGAILGPVLQWITLDTLTGLTPAIVLGTGSLGLLGGLQIDFSKFGALDRRALALALVISTMTFVFVVVLPGALLLWLHSPQGLWHAGAGLLCVGAVAMVADTGPIRAMIAYLGVRGQSTQLGLQTARFCSAIGIVVFGLIFCFYNTTSGPFVFEGPLVWLEWFGIHLILGAVFGFLFATFLRRNLSDDKTLTVLIGMVIFTSGFAYYLQLSPIFVNFILGVVIINACSQGEHVRRRLASVQRPLYIVLFFFAGVMWAPFVPLWAYGAVIPYLLLRRMGRATGGFLAVRLAAATRSAGLSRALMAPGALSVAMLLNFREVYSEHTMVYYAAAVYAMLLVAIVISEVLSYAMTRSWLIDVTDVPPTEDGEDPMTLGGG